LRLAIMRSLDASKRCWNQTHQAAQQKQGRVGPDAFILYLEFSNHMSSWISRFRSAAPG
jgi:hypothetical protein